MTTDLDRLAAEAGIEPHYYDINGVRHDTTAETKRLFLGRMGLPAETDAAVAASLEALSARRWSRLVGPVAVLAAERPFREVSVHVPEDRLALPLAWDLQREDGQIDRGEVLPAELDTQDVTDLAGGRRVRRLRLPLPDTVPDGYHDLTVRLGSDAETTACRVIVAPPRGWTPQDVIGDNRAVGIACQVYALRGDGPDTGMGHFGDLAHLCRRAGEAGLDLVGLNPLHALFPADPGQSSPYSPASRRFLNVLYIDPRSVAEFAVSAEAQALFAAWIQAVDAGASADMVDYVGVARGLLPVLRACYATFQEIHLRDGTERARAYQAFCAAEGPVLDDFATFMALQDAFAAESPAGLDWRTWPPAYHSPSSTAVAQFRSRNHDAIGFNCYLQWLADEQLAAAARAGRDAGLRIGLYADLAIGVGPASFTAWHDPRLLVTEASVGAPPDPLGPNGQNWGLSPVNPMALGDSAYEPIIEAMRWNMRRAGALRIDHVMGLMRLFWVPGGRGAGDGAYVRYPVDDLLRVMTLESRRQRCILIGEDLGTVPDGLRERLQDAGILSYRILMFERHDGGLFRQPSSYPELALVAPGTHDLPTLAGFWTGRDLDWRGDLQHFASDDAGTAARAHRRADRRQLIDALIDHADWPGEPWTDSDAQDFDSSLLSAVYRFLAATPSRLMMVAIEDLVRQVEQMNLPGTTTEHPNWCRRLPGSVDAIFDDAAILRLLSDIVAARHGRRVDERRAS